MLIRSSFCFAACYRPVSRHIPSPFNDLAAATQTRRARPFTSVATHSYFPASLYRFQVGRDSRLFNYQLDEGHIEDGVQVGADGLVHSRTSDDIPFSNGDVLMPNTFTFQEMMRTSFDDYADGSERDPSAGALVLRIPKGTAIPNSLRLIHEHSSRFSLQPAGAMDLNSLNRILSELYATQGIFTDAEEWMDANEYGNAVADEAIDAWMSV